MSTRRTRGLIIDAGRIGRSVGLIPRGNVTFTFDFYLVHEMPRGAKAVALIEYVDSRASADVAGNGVRVKACESSWACGAAERGQGFGCVGACQ